MSKFSEFLESKESEPFRKSMLKMFDITMKYQNRRQESWEKVKDKIFVKQKD